MKTNYQFISALVTDVHYPRCRPPKQASFAALLLGLTICWGAMPAVSQSSPNSTITDDLAKRSSNIHWPAGFSPGAAALFAHNEIFIKAPSAVVWRHLVAAQNWPAWYPNAQEVRVANNQSGTLQQDSVFEWSTFGLPITSFVYECVPNSRLAWFGKSKGLDAVFYHTWYLVPTSDGCQMITEEVVQGPGAVAFREKDPSALHRGHEIWLKNLKQLAETNAS
ncbi:MAG: SRPBCC domain-containing protein [Verrucomicrobia bacterium]|nr:SRPBCC domain-containing protein [Verrucomicrobiota bacterium]